MKLSLNLSNDIEKINKLTTTLLKNQDDKGRIKLEIEEEELLSLVSMCNDVSTQVVAHLYYNKRGDS